MRELWGTLGRALGLSLALGVIVTPSVAAQAQNTASLQVVVVDSTGAVIVGATLEAARDGSNPVAQSTDARGTATFRRLSPGIHTLKVSAPGFAEFLNPKLSLRPGVNRVEVALQIAGFVDEVLVTRDPLEAATDPQGDSMSVTLSADELDALPDSEEELQQILNDLAGPDGELQVDGFIDGSVPSKDQIQEIRVSRTMFSADNHGRGGSRIEIVSRPGMDRWRSTVSFAFRDDALNARNAFATTDTPEQTRRVSASTQGPLVAGRTSLSASVERLSAYESPIIRAADQSGLIGGVIRQPEDQVNVSIRLQHALSRTHSARLEYQDRSGQEDNLGIGNFDLPERAYSRTSTRRVFRLGTNGTFARRVLNEFRAQASWDESANSALNDAPTIRVLDSLTRGGANIKGGRSERRLQLTDKLETRWRAHTLSAGGQFDWMNFRSDEIRNASGTFTFSSPEDYEARRPLTFTQRRGDPTVQYSMFQGAWFFQDDIRLRKGLAIGFGLRHEWQTHLPEIWNLAPRAGFSWSPFANGRTTVRGGVGIFHDWYGASTYEETVQVDGTRVEDLTIRFPDFPDPLLADAAIVLPRGRVQASPTLEMTTVRQATIALERRLGRDVRVNVNYTFRDGVDLLRGRDVNAPGPTGVRPDPSIGNVIEIQSIGQEREHEISTALSGRLPFRRLFLSGRYSWDNHRNDGDGALSLPADNNNPDEWGPARGDVRHRFTALSSLDLPANVQLGVNVRAESAPPYNITTGHDDNGDTVFNDRPAGVGRNTARAEGLFRLDLRLSWRVGANQSGGRSEGRSELAQRTGGSERARRPDSRIRGELYIRVTNLLNSVTGSGYSGVMTSPFFGLPRAAQAARRAEVGTRISF